MHPCGGKTIVIPKTHYYSNTKCFVVFVRPPNEGLHSVVCKHGGGGWLKLQSAFKETSEEAARALHLLIHRPRNGLNRTKKCPSVCVGSIEIASGYRVLHLVG